MIEHALFWQAAKVQKAIDWLQDILWHTEFAPDRLVAFLFARTLLV